MTPFMTLAFMSEISSLLLASKSKVAGMSLTWSESLVSFNGMAYLISAVLQTANAKGLQ